MFLLQDKKRRKQIQYMILNMNYKKTEIIGEFNRSIKAKTTAKLNIKKFSIFCKALTSWSNNFLNNCKNEFNGFYFDVFLKIC